ncbi:MAG: hypothetical protein LBI54_04130, partial [Lachnospiraceae bacterium]|nr:hypothetical protein [Lachnospiraceae bacterium]
MFKQLNYIFNKSEKIKLALLLIMVIAGSFLELLSISLFQPFSEILMNEAMIQEKDYLRYIYERFQFGGAERFLIALAIVIAFVYVVKNIYMIVQKNLIYKFSYRIQKEISTKLLVSYMRQPYTFHLKKNIAVMQRSVQEDADLFTKAIIHALELLVEIAVCLVLGVYLYYISRSITVIVVSVLLACVAFFYLVSKKYSTNLGRKNQEYKGMIFQWMNQSLGGIKEIKILGREQYFIDSFGQYFGSYVQGLKNVRLIGVVPKHFIEMFSVAGLMVAVIIKLLYGYKDADVFVA